MLNILATAITQQTLGNKGILRGILHPYHRTAIHRGYLKSHMQLAGGGSANHHGNVKTGFLHLANNIHHLLQARGDKTAKSDNVHLLLDGLAHNLFGRNHHSHVDYLVVVACHHHTHNVLSDVVDVALYSGNEHLSGFGSTLGATLLDMWLEDGYGLLHGAGSLNYLWQEHLSAAEELTNGIHAVHQRSLDDVDCLGIDSERLGKVGLKMVANTLDKGILEALGKGEVAPLLMLSGG